MYPIRVLCQVMEVSTSGFYDYRKRLRNGRADQEEQELVLRAKAIHERMGGVYGARRMARELQAEGFDVGRYRARSLMRKAGIAVRRKKRFRATTDSRHRYPVAPNQLARRFEVTAPNRVWGADITYLWTNQGWLYLAVVIDLFSRRVVGWALAEHMRLDLVSDALLMAVWRRKPPAGLIHHSDRGSQYACHAYQALLAEHGFVCSMSRKGNCWDNAPVERFFGSLKRERTDLRIYATREEMRADVIDYIEMFYNSQRRHSYLGYTSPMQFEALANVA
jgi:transposase InsO family protein